LEKVRIDIKLRGEGQPVQPQEQKVRGGKPRFAHIQMTAYLCAAVRRQQAFAPRSVGALAAVPGQHAIYELHRLSERCVQEEYSRELRHSSLIQLFVLRQDVRVAFHLSRFREPGTGHISN
jgi:hypothetical protein